MILTLFLVAIMFMYGEYKSEKMRKRLAKYVYKSIPDVDFSNDNYGNLKLVVIDNDAHTVGIGWDHRIINKLMDVIAMNESLRGTTYYDVGIGLLCNDLVERLRKLKGDNNK